MEFNSTDSASFDVLSNETTEIPLKAGACSDLIPSARDYLSNLDVYLKIVIALANILALTVICIYMKNIATIIKITPKRYKTKTIVLLTVYPIVSISSILSIWIPRAFVLTETVSALCFFYGAFIFYNLCMDYVEGESNFIKSSDQMAFNMRTPPCFCCCPCFSRQEMSKDKFVLTRWMVLQLSIVQSIVALILNVLYIEERRIYSEFEVYFMPFVIISIIVGVWGLNITVRMIASYFRELDLMKKYVVLQLVLIFCKLQPAVAESVVDLFSFKCRDILTTRIYRNATVNTVIIAEMLLLLVIAIGAYKKSNY